jgi:hypothetical protein
VGLRRGRRPVSPLAIDYRRQTNLPKHVGAVSRCVQANDLEVALLVTTAGFKFYQRVIGRVFGPACHYGKVMKTRRNDRVSAWSELRPGARDLETATIGFIIIIICGWINSPNDPGGGLHRHEHSCPKAGGG